MATKQGKPGFGHGKTKRPSYGVFSSPSSPQPNYVRPQKGMHFNFLLAWTPPPSHDALLSVQIELSEGGKNMRRSRFAPPSLPLSLSCSSMGKPSRWPASMWSGSRACKSPWNHSPVETLFVAETRNENGTARRGVLPVHMGNETAQGIFREDRLVQGMIPP